TICAAAGIELKTLKTTIIPRDLDVMRPSTSSTCRFKIPSPLFRTVPVGANVISKLTEIRTGSQTIVIMSKRTQTQ
ncbi:MAG: hypothetical protein ACI81Q_000403, partial [Paracoccaceae bacterium]